ncbi:MAG: hypothetical protein KYX62_05975 [Pseudomonadota bacterium]|nr:hypothetical protein [Pseudomonadota bacterium]
MNTQTLIRKPAADTASATLVSRYRIGLALLFSGIFHVLALVLVGMSVTTFVGGLGDPAVDMTTLVIKSINALVIALAMYELGMGVGKEYTSEEAGENIYQNIRRTITRFVGTVCIALVLEALIMIIKYSQLELAGNLYYPVAILGGCALLLIALGGFLALTQRLVPESAASEA